MYNEELTKYLDTLPEYVRESINQSGIKVTSVEQAKELVKNLNNN